MGKKLVLAYSGGLDTSVAVRWLTDKDYDVIALTVDVGLDRDPAVAEERALAAGAIEYRCIDAKDDFIRFFAFPALAAGAMYQGRYPLATALARPLIAKLMVDVAREVGAKAVGHGCTGKGNDQVRFDVSTQALAPDLEIVAPVREWELTTRELEIEYAEKHNIPVPVTKKSPYSVDENLWGRSIESGPLEDPWNEPDDEVYAWTKSVADAPDEPAYIEIAFERGVPTALDGAEIDGVALVERLNALAGEHGIGRIDHMEDRLVGIKSREIYEAPAATTLLAAHQALERLTLSKSQLRLKTSIGREYADLIYDGLWFTAHHQDIASYVQSSQRHVTGTIRLRLHKGQATAVGSRSPKSLYATSLATYAEGDQYDQSAAKGFIHIWGLPVRVQAQTQLLAQSDELLHIASGSEE
ncbi:MAG: argininosuccinate synthase [Chloroflexi bacterium]|nr:argininosuccinate synthase [Chloroflexota bacterium]MCI0889994.1 argininosuccinate synthase [Chloroflexota bacterium]